jgi:hypothetical protein
MVIGLVLDAGGFTVKDRARSEAGIGLGHCTTNRLALPSPRFLAVPCLGLPRGLGWLGT